jgi:hypothetical protein
VDEQIVISKTAQSRIACGQPFDDCRSLVCHSERSRGISYY